MQLNFRGDFPGHIERAAEHVLGVYETLHDCTIIIDRSNIRGSTMQVQPVLTYDSIFTGFDTYKLTIAEFVRDSSSIAVNDLPEDVIVGWLAHEFGHIVDYESRNVMEMALYGVSYVFSKQYARKVEKEADIIAVEHGFYRYVRKTKEFLLSDEISTKYRDKLMRSYMSIEDLDICNLEWEGRVPD